MNRIDLIKVEHSVKIGDQCPTFEPNVTEDSIFYVDGEAIGFYLTKMPEKMCKLADLADNEFNSNNVPKTKLDRSDVLKAQQDNPKLTRTQAREIGTSQMSAIIGSVPPKPQFKRDYPTRSSVHSVKTAQTFIKAMLLLAKESEKLIKEIIPAQYEKQLDLFKDVNKKWRFGDLFTSSISNYNISAPFHRDTGNIKGAVNVIICKKHNSKGGDLHVPDYGATIGQQDNSILVYPAWKNVHGVTPIEPTFDDGYRNSLIFYPLKAFKGL
tara:strand:- start:35 stop:838 length:804 start_codon:yes stop_codon:yes gene_type:complete